MHIQARKSHMFLMLGNEPPSVDGYSTTRDFLGFDDGNKGLYSIARLFSSGALFSLLVYICD